MMPETPPLETEQMRILYLTGESLERSWAPTHHVLGTCQAFAKQGHEVTLIHAFPTRPRRVASAWAKAEITRWSPPVRGGGRLFHRSIARYLRTHAAEIAAEFDVLYIRFIASTVIAEALTHITIPTVLEVNGSEEFAARGFNECTRASDLVLVDSAAMAEMFRHRLPDQAAKVAVHVSPATDIERFAPRDKQACRAFVGLSPDAIILLHVSGFWTHHDFRTAELALRQLNQGSQRAMLVLLGDGPRWRAVRSSLMDLIKSGQVLMPGAVPIAEVPLYIGAADVCLNLWHAPFLRRGNLLGFKLYEYVASERPVIESADFTFPIQEWARKTLWLVPPESPERVANAVLSITSDAARWKARCAEGRSYVKQFRSWDAATRSTVSKLLDLRQRLGTSSVFGTNGHVPASSLDIQPATGSVYE